MDGVIYSTTVVHRRFEPVDRSFRYRVFSILLDVERIDALAARLHLFSHNRFNLLSFHDRDHGPRDGSSLRPWIDALLAEHGVDLRGGRVLLLCYPRVLGYVFNPLSVWYCLDADEDLRAIFCEVSNTFGERHGYLLQAPGGGPMDWRARLRKAKCFHVSPFFDVRGEYRFRFTPPRERISVRIDYLVDGRPMLYAAQTGRRAALTDRRLVAECLRVPLMTFKVIALIHWQALKLWWRRVPFRRKPQPPSREVT